MKKALIWLHKWLGVALALLFLMWFVSGLVLYYVPFPALTQAEKIAGATPLRVTDGCCLSAQQAAAQAGIKIGDARLGMLGAQPVWRVLTDGPQRRWLALDARSGAPVPALSQDGAMALAERFSGRRAVHTEALERDQWTVAQGLNPYRPLLRVELDGDDGLELYVSPAAADVVAETRRAERAWNWVGAVPHWIYFTELRRWPDVWHQVIVWLSLPGVLLALTGIALGVWQLFLNRTRWIPYRVFWMRWHHILGLAAGVVTFTWILSGLFSMNPFAVFSPRGATQAELKQWRAPQASASASDAAAPALLPVADALAAALAAPVPLQASEVELLPFAGQTWYRLRGTLAGSAANELKQEKAQGQAQGQALVRADLPPAGAGEAPRALAELPEAAVRAALLGLRGSDAAGTPQLVRQHAYDDVYYARTRDANTRYARPLPVWRAQWPDGVAVYADPASARIVLRADASTRWQRVLYNGLHSFDFAPLMARPWLRDSLVIALSLLGIAMCATACVVAWRVLMPKRRP